MNGKLPGELSSPLTGELSGQLAGELLTKLKKYRLSELEYHKICELLGRAPEGVEWALFSALWSEHCSYKSSKIHLRKFKYQNARTGAGGKSSDGENAGVVDLGQGEKVVFKMESHNHPSFIEPFHGSATGVGGILRDIFTMGARPIALANYLCFGEQTAPRMKELYDGVIHGISYYGNCVGVPMITGKTQFHKKYDKNILVNAMAVGYLNSEMKIAYSGAQGIGNYVVYVGARTGADGVHGASMASESFENDSESKRPNIQIGDPFFEKLLIEACLEVIGQDLVVAIQDMGAAGLTSSSFEMAAKGNVGITMHLDRVPLRNSDLSPEDILLSESQERMLLICEPSKFAALEKVFHKWGLDSTILGEVISDRKVQLFWQNEVLCEIDPWLLTENAPRYEREFDVWKSQIRMFEEFDGAKAGVKEGFTFPNTADYDAKALYEHFDQRVGARTALACDASVGFVRLPSSGRGLAMALGCRAFLMESDAQLGALDSAYFPILQMAAKGAFPLALTDCLNFGNPEKKPIMSEFVASVEMLAQVAEVFDAPVVSGNVSFYNETLGENIVSTPALGVLGLRKNVENLPSDSALNLQNASVLVLSYDDLFFNSEFQIFAKQKCEDQLANLKHFQELVLNLSLHHLPMASKALGYESLEKEFGKIFGDSAPELLKVYQEKAIAQWKTNQLRPLYQVVFVLKDKDAATAELVKQAAHCQSFWLKG